MGVINAVRKPTMVAVAAALSLPAMAQDRADTGVGVLDEIVVTARRRN